MPKVIVTGVNGFVGGHLTDDLIRQGFDVIGVGREEQSVPQLAEKLSAYYACDLADYESVKKLPLTDAKAVINLAGLAAVGPSFDNPELYMRINTAVLDTVCKAAMEQGAMDIRILSISSGAIYSPKQPMPLTEESLTAPESSPYAASKIAMEELSLKYRTEGLDCVVARPFNHIGPGQMEGFLLPDLYKKVTESQASGEPLLVGNLTTKRDYTDVRDVAKAYVKLIASERLTHGIYNVCTGRSVSGEEILAELLNELRLTDVQPQVDESLFRPSDTPELFGDNTRLKADIDWSPEIPIEQTIKDFVASKQ
jgi:GDP-4-dehydro-6-deoxy-D-mannose reductase